MSPCVPGGLHRRASDRFVAATFWRTGPEGAILSYDKNGDQMVCVLPLPTGAINVIDNAANVP